MVGLSNACEKEKDWKEDDSLRDGDTYGIVGLWRFRLFLLIYISSCNR